MVTHKTITAPTLPVWWTMCAPACRRTRPCPGSVRTRPGPASWSATWPALHRTCPPNARASPRTCPGGLGMARRAPAPATVRHGNGRPSSTRSPAYVCTVVCIMWIWTSESPTCNPCPQRFTLYTKAYTTSVSDSAVADPFGRDCHFSLLSNCRHLTYTPCVDHHTHIGPLRKTNMPFLRSMRNER